MEWKEVPNYEGLYDLRSDGLLYSHPRQRTKGGYSYGNVVGDKEKYFQFRLYKDGIGTPIYAHCLVYKVFVGDIPENYDVHHINGNPKDNRVENLELLDCKTHYEKHREERNKKCSRPVVQLTLDGVFVAKYKSTREAERQTGIGHTEISKCCRNIEHYNTAGGFVWQFAA